MQVATKTASFGESSGSINVVLADGYPLALSGLRTALKDHRDIQVLAECTDCDRVREALKEHNPDVLMLSREMLDENLDALEALTSENQDTQVILLTSRKDPGFMQEALQRGARGVFQRERPTHHVPIAIRKVSNGELWYEREFASQMLSKLLNPSESRSSDPDQRKIASITPREREVIELTCQGLRNKEIADRLHISEATVSHHLTSIFRKLEIEDRISLVIYAVKKRMVSL
jgi:DNA-binding NarL/FixJ family response regulator